MQSQQPMRLDPLDVQGNKRRFSMFALLTTTAIYVDRALDAPVIRARLEAGVAQAINRGHENEQ